METTRLFDTISDQQDCLSLFLSEIPVACRMSSIYYIYFKAYVNNYFADLDCKYKGLPKTHFYRLVLP